MRRGGVLLALWLVVAATAITTGTWALSLVGGEISNQTVAPLSNAAIDANLDAGRADRVGGGVSVDPQVTAPITATGAVTYNLTTPGGSIVANCQQGAMAYLVSWSPAQGYRADNDMVRGPALNARLTFEADKAAKVTEVTARVRCVADLPTLDVITDAGHHDGTPASTPTGSVPSSVLTDDHGSGGHGADDGAIDDSHRGGGGSGGG